MSHCSDWLLNNSICPLQSFDCGDIPEKPSVRYSDATAVWILTAAIIVFFMKAGFMLIEVAFANNPCDRRHVIILKYQDAFASAFGFFLFGFDYISGYHTNYSKSFLSVSEPTMWFFKFSFASNAATIVGGCLVSSQYKLRIPAAFVSAFVISGLIHPLVVRIIWSDHCSSLSPYKFCHYNGLGTNNSNCSWSILCNSTTNSTTDYIRKLYVLDFAGGGAVHGVGGIAGLVLCLFAKLQEWRDKAKSAREVSSNTQPLMPGAEPQERVEPQ